MPFFEIKTAVDLLDKAKRDFAKMKAETSTGTIFNFFVTAYHIVDYVKALGTVPQPAIDQLYDDSDFKMCQFLCNKGKHIKLRNSSPFEAKYEAAVQGGYPGKLRPRSGRSRWLRTVRRARWHKGSGSARSRETTAWKVGSISFCAWDSVNS